MLEKAHYRALQLPEKPLDWATSSVTIEHILPRNSKSDDDGDALPIENIGNLALLENRLNREAGGKVFQDKRSAYRQSSFELTKKIGSKRVWSAKSITERTRILADLACRAWPPT